MQIMQSNLFNLTMHPFSKTQSKIHQNRNVLLRDWILISNFVVDYKFVLPLYQEN